MRTGKIDFLIDFDVWQDKSVTSPSNYSSNYYTDSRESKDVEEEDNVTERKTTYEKYVAAKKRLIESKKINHYFTASEVLYSKRNKTIKELMSKNGKKDYSSLPEDGTFVLDSSNNFTLKILDNPYCYQSIDWGPDHIPSSVDRNILSVCYLITFGKKIQISLHRRSS